MDDKSIGIKVELPEIVNKALEKPATILGEKLSDLIEIIFGGITYKKQEFICKREINFEKFKRELNMKIKAIPEENKIEPKESLVGPALEALKYRIDVDEIRNMFSSLIASSLNSETTESVHPGFIEIIKNLSAEDAKAIEKFALGRDRIIFPIISIDENVMSIPNDMNHFCLLAHDFGFQKSNIIISSLLRIGLIEINYVFTKDSVFQGFTFNKFEEEFAKLRHDNQIARNLSNPLKYRYGTINLTAYGYEFAKVCSPLTYDDLMGLVKKIIPEFSE
jgi:hypothetical protein